MHDAGLGGGIGDRAFGNRKAEHRGDVDDGALFLGRQHAARGFLRPEENGVEIGAEHLAPFLGRHFDGAAAMRDAGIVDQDGDGAEGFFGGIVCARHGGAVGDVGLDGDGLAAMTRAYDAAEKAFGTVTILVNNAGIAHGGRAGIDMAAEEWREVLGANAFLLARKPRAVLAAKRTGRASP